MKVRFTGTQNGMTKQQKSAFVSLIRSLDVNEFHHGDCIGADKEAHTIIKKYYKKPIFVHPPTEQKKRAFCEGYLIHPTKSYLDRNKDIADAIDVLIATPKGYKEEIRSGTWSTIRYARKRNKTIYIIDQNGIVFKMN